MRKFIAALKGVSEFKIRSVTYLESRTVQNMDRITLKGVECYFRFNVGPIQRRVSQERGGGSEQISRFEGRPFSLVPLCPHSPVRGVTVNQFMAFER